MCLLAPQLVSSVCNMNMSNKAQHDDEGDMSVHVQTHLECIPSADRPIRRRDGDLAAIAIFPVSGARDLHTSPGHATIKISLTSIMCWHSYLE